MIKLRRNSYFGDPTRARERAERARDRQREREAASNYVEALDHFLAEKVNKGELVKLQSNSVFDLYEIPKDQLRGDTLRVIYGRRAASWCTSSTPSKDRKEQEKRNLSFCVSRTPIPHISAWWNNMLMHNSQSLSGPVD
jgi:hypothetical protein